MLIVYLVQYKGISIDKMSGLLFPQNCNYCSSKMFAKYVGLVVEICCLTLFGVRTYFDDVQPKSICCKKP